MANFKPEQEVVFVGYSTATDIESAILPKKGEVVKIKYPCFDDSRYYVIKGFEKDKTGRNQRFRWDCFKPLQYESATQEILAKFPLVIEKADTQIKQVPQEQQL